MTFGSLFAGIGGMDLGLEWAGMACEWQVEIDGYARRVLAKHWPNVPKHDDVRTFPPNEGDWNVDVIAGGFPCQDISNAGKRAGITGERSGLWTEFARIIRDLRPRYVLVENVAAITSRGLDRVLGDLAEIGFDAEWQVLPACAFGAPHIRERLFIVAYRHGHELHRVFPASRPDTIDAWWLATQKVKTWDRGFAQLESVGIALRCNSYADARRILDGIPRRVDRLRGLGNAVVPQVTEWIGRRIIEHARHQDEVGRAELGRVE